MEFIPMILMAIGTAASVYGMKQQMDAADEAEDIGRANADAAQAEGDQQLAKLKDDQKRNAARMRASMAASNAGGASLQAFADAQDDIRAGNIDWTKQKTKSQVASSLSGGQQASSQATAGAYGSLGQAASFAGKGVSAYGDYKAAGGGSAPKKTTNTGWFG